MGDGFEAGYGFAERFKMSLGFYDALGALTEFFFR